MIVAIGRDEFRPGGATVITSLLRNSHSADKRRRSVAGAVLGILALPVLLGVMGCFVLPVPIGDPEKSRIDPAMTGAWIGQGIEHEVWVYLLEPFDKRCWLVTWIMLESVDDAVPVRPDAPPPATTGSEQEGPGKAPQGEAMIDPDEGPPTLQTLLPNLRAGEYRIGGIAFFKGWLTTLKGTRLLVWQQMVAPNSARGMGSPNEWWVQRVTAVADRSMDLDILDTDYGGLDEVKSRAQAERIIRRHIDDPRLFIAAWLEEGMIRVDGDDYDLIETLLHKANISGED